MNEKSVVRVFCVFSAILGLTLSDGCENINGRWSVSEIDPPGTEIFRLNATQNVTYDMKIVDPSYLKEYFTWYHNSSVSQYVLEVNITLDLEAIRDTYKKVKNLVTINIQCFENNSTMPTVQEVIISITEVNEFTPAFVNAPYHLNVSENTPVNTTIIRLREHVFDNDVNFSIPEITNFGMLPYNNNKYDGRGMFYMPRSQDGVLRVKKSLDYEQMTPGFNFYFVNVTVEDNGKLMNHTWIKITVTDSDDQGPEFYTPDCSRNCYTVYDTDVKDTYTGPLTNLRPYKIVARDRDTLDYTVIFFLKGGIPSKIEQYFAIDRTTGVVSVTQPLETVDGSHASITLVIEAQEVSSTKRSTTTTLRVDIIGRSTTGIPAATKQEPEDRTLMIVLVVMAVVLVLVICALIINIVCMKKKYKRAVAPEDTPSVSDASTDIGEFSVDEDQWPLPYTNGKMQTFGTQFVAPVLKDTATETGFKVAKKKSRVRKKKKEPDIFDGTREYEGVADPEFFTQGDKPKIKLSSRSRDNNVDPKYWITVDNDY